MKTKLEMYIKKESDKRRKVRSKCYEDGMVEGIDYVVCPMADLRKKKITDHYIINVLEISVDEFESKFPDVIRKPKVVVDSHMMSKSKNKQRHLKVKSDKLHRSDAKFAIDYIICPETGDRVNRLSAQYIESTLGMTVSKFDKKYPNIIKSASKYNKVVNGAIVYDPPKQKSYDIKAADMPPKMKLEKFIKRNARKCAHLYNDDMVEGVDYVVCPHIGKRMSMIMEKYITGVLCMTVDEYDTMYPNIKKHCDARSNAIVKGIHEIDEATGLSKHQLGIEKAKITLSSIDEDGLSGYDRLGAKTKQTHMENVDEYGRNGYSQIATKAIVKGNETKRSNGDILPAHLSDIRLKYRALVDYIAKDIINDLKSNHMIGRMGTEGAYQIDHKYSISDGMKNRVSPIAMACRENFEILHWEHNIEKWATSSMTLEELYTITGYDINHSNKEYDQVISIMLRKQEDDEQIVMFDILTEANLI